VLDLILQQVDRVVPHIGTRITLLAEGTRMRVVAAKGYSDNEEAKRATFEIAQAPLAPLIMYERETIVVRDAHTDPRWLWLPGASQVRSWCGTPLVIKDRAIGFLCVDWGEPDFYSEADARIVRAFADQAAVAIENAQLYATIKSFNEQLEHKVQQRTIELRQAHDEIAAKAEQLSALVRRVVNVQESERQRIAYDLHDSVTQAILATIYELHALHRRVDGPVPEAARQIEECRQLLESTLLEMRQIIYALRPRALDELGLLAALEHFAGAAQAHHGLEVMFQTSGASYPLDVAAELALYRIVQEATQNSIRHAGAREVTIGVEFRPRQLRVTVADDGCGFNPAQVGDGLGLVGMRERAQALGGQLTIASRAGYGTRVSLDLQRSAVERSAEP
jgi:signal transduction histidine kinase